MTVLRVLRPAGQLGIVVERLNLSADIATAVAILLRVLDMQDGESVGRTIAPGR